MSKKGFTLVELIAVIVVILMFTLISLPNIDNRTNKNEDKIKKIMEQSILDATNTYCDFNDCTSGKVHITTLINENLLDEDEIKDYYSNIDDCYLEQNNGEYILENCNPK